MRILITGGPGSGCTSTAASVGEFLSVPTFDSDTYFHKPTDPPFQEQYTPDERRELLSAALASESSWILSGSVGSWQLMGLNFTHAVFLQIPRDERLNRLRRRQKAQFGSRIEPGGDMDEEHRSFLAWAAEYEDRLGSGRNFATDRVFAESNSRHFVALTEIEPLQKIVARIVGFITNSRMHVV